MVQIAFIDFETRSRADVTQCGAYAYARDGSTEPLVLAWMFEDGRSGVWSPQWAWSGENGDLDRLFDHITLGGYVVAWNANFDRQIWNEVCVPKYGWPPLPLEQVLCAMAQAEANNLPGGLDKAAATLGLPGKMDEGKSLISRLSHGSREDWVNDDDTRKKMGRFRAYCLRDVGVMRSVWNATRPLTLVEWREYHASEQINDRGVAVDLDFARAATRYAAAENTDINAELARVTGDCAITVTAHLRKAAWLKDQLWPSPELQAVVTRAPTKKSEAAGKERLSADRATRETLLEALASPDYAGLFADERRERIVEFLEIIEAGNGAAVHKFEAICRQAATTDGREGSGAEHFRVHGQYSFNGAGQTGRFSSRGVQIHNLIRAPVDPDEPDRAIDAMEDILAGATPEALVDVYGFPVSRLLARLLRPTFVAAPGKVLVWGDWDQIEARVLPWLANSDGGERKLDLFRAGAPIYKLTAADILRKPVESITPFERQAYGKVPELALGFGGSVGAFAAMGRKYGVRLPEEQARAIVDRWRGVNAWARHFWGELWDAAMQAWADPGTWYRAGRLMYLFHPALMHGTLICCLPDGRWLVYPHLKREQYEDPKEPGVMRSRVSFLKGYGSGAARVALWYGVLAENGTQATAASFLRAALVALKESVVLHTHDEVCIEVAETNLDSAKSMLTKTLLQREPWAEGLPLSVTLEHGPYYFHR